MTNPAPKPWSGKSRPSSLSVPLVIGGVIVIGAALLAAFFGFGEEHRKAAVVETQTQLAQEPPVLPRPIQARTGSPSRPVSAPAAAPGSALLVPPPEDAGERLTPFEEHARIVQAEAVAQGDLTNGIETYRRAAVASCWPDAASAQGARLELAYGLTFDKDGNETSRGIQEEGQGVPGPVRDCLRNYEVPAFHLKTGSLARNVSVTVRYP